jgi:signal transduction histidine kinase
MGRHYLGQIRHGALRMGTMVDELLNLSRVSRRDPEPRLTALRPVVDEALKQLTSEREGRDVEVRIEELPFVDADPGLLRQVFVNLLSNALKFTRPRARACIEVGQIAGSMPPVIYVRDNGVGFNMKYANKLFGVFQRLHRAEDFEGTGVGLATVQRIILKHGGRVWAEGELNRGATFYFTLEAGEAAPATAACAEPAAVSSV